MRNFQMLVTVTTDTAAGIIRFEAAGESTCLTMRREGDYLAISASHGPVEIALRPRFQELTRVLKALQPIEGLQTTRQIGTAQSYVAVGLRSDGGLNVRPTLVADASGYLCLNLSLSADACKKLFEWMEIASS